MKGLTRKVLSFVLVCAMVLGLTPMLAQPADAATNLAGGFEGQDACIMRAAAATDAQSERPPCPVGAATLRSRCATYLK